MAFLTKVFGEVSKNGSRKKLLLKGKKLSTYGWSDKEEEAYKGCMELLQQAVSFAVLDPRKKLCLFTDASQTGCSIVVTQTSSELVSSSVLDDDHEIVFINAHVWNQAEANWHISSQEAYPIVMAIEKLQHLFAGRFLHIFTDHFNLETIFDPCTIINNKTALHRLARWALIIQSQQYSIKSIPGLENILADMFSRWQLKGTHANVSIPSYHASVARMLKSIEDYNNKGTTESKTIVGKRSTPKSPILSSLTYRLFQLLKFQSRFHYLFLVT
jgi:hypothetical protein